MEHSMQVFTDVLIGFGTTAGIAVVAYPCILAFNRFKNGTVSIELANSPIKITRSKNLVASARIAYVEIANRKLAIEFSEEHDSISEIYNSYYNAFGIIKNLLKNLSQNGKEGDLYRYLKEYMNSSIRNHLDKHQAKYRSWLEKQRRLESYEDENTSQRKYRYYSEIVDDLNLLNKKSIEMLSVIEAIAYQTNSWKTKITRKRGKND